MNLLFPVSYLQAKFGTKLPPPHDVTLDERTCRYKTRGAGWNFRISKGYVKGTLRNHLRFRLTDQD